MMNTAPPDIADVLGSHVPITVVAVKVPGVCILRAIGAFLDRDRAIAALRPYVTLVNVDVEWTEHSYRVPSYLIYGSGDLPHWGWPQAGIYLFPYNGGDPRGGIPADTYRGPAELVVKL